MNFYIKTYGCKLNQADSEIMREILLKKHKETSIEDADFVVINTCGVVEKTERKILKESKKLKDKGKRIIISGCLPKISLEECKKVADAIIGPSNILLIEEAVKRDIIETRKINLDKSSLPSKIVSISEGCLGNCSYCATKLARKKLFSFGEENIIEKIRNLVNKNIKEILLTSQDLSIYGIDRGTCLSNLLEKIIKINGKFKIKLGMMNPKYIDDRLLNLYESDKIYKFIHLPLQSGDDNLLKKMHRGYLSSDFENIVKKFRKLYKESIIATDIIVGHPLETEESFNKTIKLIKKIKPEVIHIFKFSRRKGTEDFELKDLPDRIKKERSRKLSKLFQEENLIKNKKYINKKFNVLIVEKRNNKYLARTDSGRAVVLNKGKIGEYINVIIKDCKWNYLIADKLS
ncbi:MAG: tRNA (N(6)-L-threonylcarbamoyladenosine(37)-C(2))-methylthiotransferase [Candidatus Pacebacteria bacterium]|nr:tRNA (N(6)-L-threonylcarbamoyladenosine(37)-C(2))-methylthiotransferase [Candidatus Paceibacterota bacterium]